MTSAFQAGAGLYVHVPFCDGKCPYCAFYSVPYEAELADRLLAALARELALARQADAWPPAVATVYVGGGTPSVLSADQLARLAALIRPLLASAAAEWTVEMNPGSITAGKLAVLVRAGVNRISLGAQSFDDGVLRALGRRHTARAAERAVALARDAGIENIGLDLIAGAPGGNAGAWCATLRRTVALAPRHVSVYALTPEEGTRLGRAAASGDIVLADDDGQLAALRTAEQMLTAAGFERYEISNYARPGFACQHHGACWRGGEYLGLGPAAASHRGLERWTNRPDLAAYLAALEQGRNPPREYDHLTPQLKAREIVIFGLRLTAGISAADAAGFLPGLRRLQRSGLAARRGTNWALTPRGRELADHAAVELLAAADGF